MTAEDLAGRAVRPVRRIRSLVRRYWRPATALVAIEATTLFAIAMVTAPVALAGDTLPQGGNGDCWRAGTPWMCRTNWTGRGSQIHMRIIDVLSDGELHNRADEACSNWNSAPGPQFCSWNAVAGDTWTYLKINDNLGAPNGVTLNCTQSACPTSNGAGNILWSEIYVPHANTQNLQGCNGQFGFWATPVFAHEIGHAYGLAHHGTACSGVTLMTQGSGAHGPTGTDIGPFPGCSGGAGTGGVRCIYEDT